MAKPNLDLRDRLTSTADQLVYRALGLPFAQAAATSSVGFAVVRADACVIWANAAFSGLTCIAGSPVGVQLDHALDVQFRLAKDEASNAFSAADATTLELHSSRSAPVMLHIASLDGDQRVIVAASAAGELRHAPLSPQGEAMINPLTRLGTKRQLAAQLDAWAGETGLTLMRIDLDGFNDINESLGRIDGDRLLQLVADRLTRVSRAADAVFHISGDEFVVLQPSEAPGMASASAIAERLTAIFDRPFRLDDRLVEIGASVGVALVQAADQDGAKEMLRKTEEAVKQAKRAGGQTWRVFSDAS